MTQSRGVHKYLHSYAEPEAAQIPAGSSGHRAGLVVPAYAESLALLDGFRDAARGAEGRIVLVLVVNSPRGASSEQRAASLALLESLRKRAVSPCAPLFWQQEPEFSLLVVDRASPGRELDDKVAVGHARKIGADIVLALWAAGALELPFVFSSDADVTLPSDYFERAATLVDAPAALLFPFRHVDVDSGDGRVHEATELYELSLRYHVLGLDAARSPYAYHSVGSCLAAHVEHYAAVRGFPKRAAGEDFYLLDKLGKVGQVRRLGGAPLAIASRRSLRVPFGTGPRVERLLQDPSMLVESPLAYQSLGLLLAALDAFARERQPRVFDGVFASLDAPVAQVAEQALVRCGLRAAAQSALEQVGSGNLRRRLHTWFDALRSLQFLHALSERALPKLPCLEAVTLAPFCTSPKGASLGAALSRAIELEAALPDVLGPAAWTEPRAL
ncbi:MAG: hypothetical protein QM756_20510 [Polyangiaceae bacterium]